MGASLVVIANSVPLIAAVAGVAVFPCQESQVAPAAPSAAAFAIAAAAFPATSVVEFLGPLLPEHFAVARLPGPRFGRRWRRRRSLPVRRRPAHRQQRRSAEAPCSGRWEMAPARPETIR